MPAAFAAADQHAGWIARAPAMTPPRATKARRVCCVWEVALWAVAADDSPVVAAWQSAGVWTVHVCATPL